MNNDILFYVLQKLIKISEVSFQQQTTHRKIENFLDFSNLLDQYKISTMAIKANSSNLGQLSFPAITQLKIEDKAVFVILESFDNQMVSYYDGEKTVQESMTVFEQKWSGNVLLLAKDEFSGEANFEQNLAQSKAVRFQKIIGFGALACLVIAALWLCQNFRMGLWWVLQMLGLGISSLLLINEFGEPSAFIQKLCHVGKTTDCSTVLNSDKSKIFNWLSWSEMAFLYFGFVVLSPFFIGENAIQSIFGGFSSVSILPITAVSIYYQWRLLKTWCTLCLGIIGVLWCSAILVILNGFEALNFTFPLASLGIMGLWFLIKPAILAQKENQRLQYEARQYQENNALFKVYLESESAIDIAAWPNEVSTGDADAPVVITMVSNPFCKPCAAAHEEIADWSRYFEAKVVYRFTVNTHEPDHEANRFIKHLYSIADPEIQAEALEAWYGIKDFKKWAVLYPVVENPQADDYLMRSAAWSQEVNIAYTPTIFINGYLLKEPYRVTDLKHHLRFLMEG
jgi:protein-disulfide isomerase